MNVNEFIEKYNKVENKEKYVKEHITNKYVSYTSKIDECKNIIAATSYKEVDGKQIYWKNTPGQFFLFMCRLITLYTDIEIGVDETIIESFDKLNEIGLINIIISSIPQSEYEEFRNILSMCEDDNYENTRSFVSYIDTKIEAMKLLFDGISGAFESPEVQEQVMKLINK